MTSSATLLRTNSRQYTLPNSPRRRHRHNPWLRIPLLVLMLASVTMVVVYGIDNLVHSGEVLTGVRIGTVDLSGLDDLSAQSAMERYVKQSETTPQRWTVDATAGEVVPSGIGFAVDAAAGIDAALAVGRTGNPLRRFAQWARARLSSTTLPMPTKLDLAQTRSYLNEIAFEAKAAPVEPLLDFEGVKPILTPGVAGTGIDNDEAARRLQTAFADPARKTVKLPTVQIPPRYTDKQASDAGAQALATLLAAPVDVTLDGTTTKLEPGDLGPLLVSTPGPDQYGFAITEDATVDLLRPRFENVGTPPVNARFVVSGGNVQIIRGQLGVGCCGAGTASLIQNAMSQTDPAMRTAELPKGDVPPGVTSDDLKGLGVTKKLAEFTTSHPAGEPRVQNIHKIADLMTGTVVRKGEQFSINRKVGRRTTAKGWVDAPTILEGKMDKSPGGGISQFATTMYNALYFAGIQIDEHTPHTKYISRYPKGREATLSYPSPDLVFTNDTPGAILIWTSYNDTSITVSLWGTDDGRKAAASEPEITSADGCEVVAVTRTIRYADGKVRKQPYTQRYCP